MRFTRLPPDEIERRRILSAKSFADQKRVEFEAWHQEACDKIYMQNGPCCAGCDHWGSNFGVFGACAVAGVLSGDEVARSLGIECCTYTPPPGLPYTMAEFHCGKFKDDFDWQSLPKAYLSKIGYSSK